MTSKPDPQSGPAVEHPDEPAARAALDGVAEPGSVGVLLEVVDVEDGVQELRFEAELPGYPGWRWTVALATVDSDPPTVLEVELLPGESALVAPAWVPWAERLAEYRRTHPDAEEVVEAALEDELELDELDDDDLDEAGDLDDGIEIDDVERAIDEDDLDELDDDEFDELDGDDDLDGDEAFEEDDLTDGEVDQPADDEEPTGSRIAGD